MDHNGNVLTLFLCLDMNSRDLPVFVYKSDFSDSKHAGKEPGDEPKNPSIWLNIGIRPGLSCSFVS